MHSPEIGQESRGRASVVDEILIQGFSNYISSLLSPKTVKEYVKDVRAWAEWWKRPVEHFNQDEWDDWTFYETERGIKATSIARHRASLKRFFQYLRRKQLVTQDPAKDCEKIRKPRTLPVYLTEAEMGQVRVNIRNSRQRAMVVLLYDCGLRNAEMRALLVEDVAGGYVHVRQGKRDKERYVPISNENMHVIDVWLKDRPKESRYLISSELGNRLPERTVQKTVVSLARGIPKHVTPHTLRHSIATHLYNRGVDLRDIQEFLGHDSIETTRRYVHVAKEGLRSRIMMKHPSQ